LSVLFAAYKLYPTPQDLESTAVKLQSQGFPRTFWLYIVATGCVAAGYADFSLVAYHFKRAASVPGDWIPVFYAVAMGTDALSALVCGRLFERLGLSIMVIAIVLSSLFAPFVFIGEFYSALFGMMLWGIGMGAQESIMRAAVANLVPTNRLGFAFGVFNTGYGLFWFVGSALMGVMYDYSVHTLVFFSVASQIVSVPILLAARKHTS
jgi:predicted MFS family arabinose efflux permease